MAHELITNFESFAPSSVSYGAPRTNARGGKSIKIQDARKNTLILSTPLILTWGANKMVDEDTGRVSYNMSIQFPNEQYGTDSTRDFFEKMKQFESNVLDACVKNSKEWFGKTKMSREVAEALFTPILKYPKDKVTGEPDYDRAPTMRIKIPYWDGKFNVELYDTDRNPIFTPDTDLEGRAFEGFIPKASHIAGAIQCNGLWFAAGKFGVTWQLVQAIVRRPVRLQGGCFLTMNSDDHKTLDDVARREAETSASAEVAEELDTMAATNVDDSDDEDQSAAAEEEEPEPEPKPVVKKKRRVVKKKTAAA
jgi:hypothetical protein